MNRWQKRDLSQDARHGRYQLCRSITKSQTLLLVVVIRVSGIIWSDNFPQHLASCDVLGNMEQTPGPEASKRRDCGETERKLESAAGRRDHEKSIDLGDVLDMAGGLEGDRLGGAHWAKREAWPRLGLGVDKGNDAGHRGREVAGTSPSKPSVTTRDGCDGIPRLQPLVPRTFVGLSLRTPAWSTGISATTTTITNNAESQWPHSIILHG